VEAPEVAVDTTRVEAPDFKSEASTQKPIRSLVLLRISLDTRLLPQ